MELFNLKNDLGESQDLSGSNPVKRGELLSETDEVDSRNSCSYSCEIESLLSRVGE